MEVRTLSPSRLKASRLCEKRLLAKTEDETYQEDRGELASIGTLAHEAAKLWYRHPEKYPNDAQQACFHDAIQECADARFGDENPREAEGVAEARVLFENIITRFPRDQIKVVFTERRLKGTISKGVPIHLIIDLAIDKGDGRLHIIDYKTGFVAMTTEEMWAEDQVLMNLLAINKYDSDSLLDPFRDSSGRVRCTFTYSWTRYGYETGPIELTNDRLDDYDAYLASEYQRLLDLDDDSAVERINPYCGSCGRRLKCTKYRELMTEVMNLDPAKDDPTGAASAESVAALKPEDLIEAYSGIAQQEKLLKSKKSMLGDAIKAMHKLADADMIEHGDFRSKLVSRKDSRYDVLTVLTIARERNVDPANMLSATNKRVESQFASDPQAMAMLKQTASTSRTTAYLSISASEAARQRDKAEKKAAKAAEKAAAKAAQAAAAEANS